MKYAAFLPLAVIVTFLLAVRLTGCQIFPVLPGESTNGQTTSASTGESSESGTQTDGTTTVAETTATPTPQLTDATAVPTPVPTTTVPTATDPLSANNDSLGWSFIYADPPGQDLPTGLPDNIRRLIAKYDVAWQAVATEKPKVCLTFDMGYEYNDNTAKILDAAAAEDVSLTFFLTGSYLDKNPELILRMVEEGHLCANHSYAHPDTVKMLADQGPAAVMDDLHRLETSFRKLTGKTLSRYYRPPSGTYSEQLLDLMTRESYTTVFWSFAYRDWLTDDQPDPDQASQKILGQLHDGSIILLHAVSNTNTELLPDLIDDIKARGYDIVRLDELLKG